MNEKVVNKSYKFRMYPNKTQQELINKTIGSARFIYNHFLSFSIESYKVNNKKPTFNANCKTLTTLKNEQIWLKEVDKFALQNSLKDLELSYQNFFREIKKGNSKQGLPKFKSKRKAKLSYKTTWMKTGINKNSGKVKGNIEISNNKIKLPKLKWVKCKNSFNLSNVTKINNVTITSTRSGKYFASVSCEVLVKSKPKTNKNIGIDLGIKEFAIFSDKTIISNPKFTTKYENKLAKAQRKLSRMQFKSNNYEKQRIKVAKIHEKIKNCRNDFLHKTTTNLIKSYDIICIEDLDVKGLIENTKLSKYIADVSLCEFKRQLEYKANWYGKMIAKVDRFYPSSQLCNNCGNKSSQTKDLNCRTYICEKCGLEIDRDYNASINILNEGLRTLKAIN